MFLMLKEKHRFFSNLLIACKISKEVKIFINHFFFSQLLINYQTDYFHISIYNTKFLRLFKIKYTIAIKRNLSYLHIQNIFSYLMSLTIFKPFYFSESL